MKVERITEYDRKVGLIGIINGYKNRCTNLRSFAEYLNVTEEYLRKALIHYHLQYFGVAKLDNYIIYFYPKLCILEIVQ